MLQSLILLSCTNSEISNHSWQYTISQAKSPAKLKNTTWQRYSLGKEIKTKGEAVWLRMKTQKTSAPLLFIPVLATQGLTNIYIDNDLVYEKYEQNSKVFIESFSNDFIPHLISIGHKEYSYLYLKLEKNKDHHVSLKKDIRFIDEKDYIELIFIEFFDTIGISIILLFIALLALPMSFYFKEERKRFLILSLLNISVSFVFILGNPYFNETIARHQLSIKWIVSFMDFIPLFVIWFIYVSVFKYKIFLKFLILIHILIALLSFLNIIYSFFPLSDINLFKVRIFVVTQIALIIFVFKNLFFLDTKSRLLAISLVPFFLISIIDFLKFFDIILLTEKPLYQWGFLFLSITMIFIMIREFDLRTKQINENIVNLEQLAFITSHKLRLPMANIIGILNLFKSGFISTNEYKKFLHQLYLSSKQLDIVTLEMNRLTGKEAKNKYKLKHLNNPISEIILVDDDEINNIINKKLFEKAIPNLDLTIFERARHALDYLKKNNNFKNYIIYLDINMPEMNGFEFLEEVENLYQDTPIFMLSSSINQEDMEKAYKFQNVIGYIVKPLKKEDLLILTTLHNY